MLSKRIVAAVALALGGLFVGIGGMAPADAGHEWREELDRYYDQQRRRLHETRRARLEQIRRAHEARREALEHQWQQQRKFLRGEARAHFDRDYHHQREARERAFNREVRALQQWLDDELKRLNAAERYEREGLEHREQRVERYRGTYPGGSYAPGPYHPDDSPGFSLGTRYSHQHSGASGRPSLHLGLGNFHLEIPLDRPHHESPRSRKWRRGFGVRHW